MSSCGGRTQALGKGCMLRMVMMMMMMTPNKKQAETLIYHSPRGFFN